MRLSSEIDLAEVFGELGGAQQVGVVLHDLDRRVELVAVGENPRGAYLGDRQFAQFLDVVAQGLVELIEALDPELDVGRPGGRVECASRCADGGFGFLDACVGSMSHQFAGRRVVGRERALGGDELPVDQQPLRHFGGRGVGHRGGSVLLH